MEITPFLQRESPEPLYGQLCDWIRKEIEEGRLLPGMKMPSIRHLMTHLKVSRNTIETAYQQLQSEGYLESIPKRGIWVAEIEKPLLPMSAAEREEYVRPENGNAGERIVDFKYGTVDPHKFPLKHWKKALADAADQMLQYGDNQGEPELRREISNYLLQSRGVRCTPEQIVVTSGTQASVTLICRLLELRGKTAAMEEPGYYRTRSVLKDQGCRIAPVPLEKDGLSVQAVERSGADAVYVTPSHQFPFGMIMSVSKRMRLLKWAYRTGGYIIEDDYDSEFRYQGQPIPSLKSLDEQERVIYLGTFSKSFLPSARLSYLVLPPSLTVRYSRKFAHYHQSASPVIQKAIAGFMQSGEFEKHIRRMRKAYHRKHQALLKSIKQYMGSQADIVGEKSGLHILLKLNNASAFETAEKALQKGVKVHSLSDYWSEPNAEADGYLMLGFGGLSAEDIETGIRSLAACLPHTAR
ncbi:MocR-like pyridoxine biosynthesis transcription factor PdxR [Saccharibacillus alkalitolerans]|nr:PLP-dependent aminotransferase family protein [Saccharibacillus alkalitolerans]